MRVACLDLSTHCGYAVLEGELGQKPELKASGTIDLDRELHSFGPYPKTYRKCAEYMAERIMRHVDDLPSLGYFPDVYVIEEVNLGRDRYVQKLLENIHTAVLAWLEEADGSRGETRVVYLNSDGADGWRRNLGLVLSKEQKKSNAKLSKAKRLSEAAGTKLDKNKLGIKGKINKKHLAVALANSEFNLKLLMKDNNEADAICLGLAFFNGCTPCDGIR
jgi:hypothetical protein